MRLFLDNFIKAMKDWSIVLGVLGVVMGAIALAYSIGLQLGQNRQVYLQDQITEQSERNGTLQLELTSTNKKINSLLFGEMQYKEEINSLKNDLSRLKTELSGADTQLKRNISTISEFERKQQQAEYENRNLSYTISQLRNNLKEYPDVVKKLKEEIEFRKNAAANLSKQNQDLKNDLSEASRKYSESFEKLSSALAENKTLSEEILYIAAAKENNVRKLQGKAATAIIAYSREYNIPFKDDEVTVRKINDSLILTINGVSHSKKEGMVATLLYKNGKCLFDIEEVDQYSARLSYYCYSLRNL